MPELETAHAPHVAHQFETAEQQRDASSLGMWTFLATEVMFFGGLFTGFCVYRFTNPEVFGAASRQLDVMLGTINTAVLLTSSLAMALAVRAGQTGDRRWQVRNLIITMILGAAFLGIKGREYYEEYEKHLVPGLNFDASRIRLPIEAKFPAPPESSQPPVPFNEEGTSLSTRGVEATSIGLMERRAELFFVFYFFMTALHGLHMIIGIAVVAVIAVMAWRGKFSPEYHTPLELTGLYWHFVDIVWVFLYPTLYLIDLHK